MGIHKIIILIGLLLLCGFSRNVRAQDRRAASLRPPFVLGIVETLRSTILAEKRTLNIYLPEGYAVDSTARYPVIYLLDGSANEDFVHITGIVQFLTMIGRMPKTIIVGIANVDRKRDFTFPTTIDADRKAFPSTGGSANFRSFLQKELIPFVERRYRTNASRMLIGQSLGGLLATEILLRSPAVFTDYVIVSPSLWWDKESLLAEAPKLQKTASGEALRVCIMVGKEGEQMEGDARRLASLLQASGTPDVVAHLAYMPEENHLTILHNSVYKALELLHPLPTPKEK